MQELILASSSSRRHSLLTKLGLAYSIVKPSIDETPSDDELPDEYVSRIAQSKARAVSNYGSHNTLVLAADTVVSFADEIIGKPKNTKDAKRILQMLSGMEHEVLTGICCITEEAEFSRLAQSKVKLKMLTDKEIDTYCLSGEPNDKAGAYAIQGEAARFIEYVSGSYSNVVGLPLLVVAELLKQAKLTLTNKL